MGRRCHRDHTWLYGSGSAGWGHGSASGNEVDSPSAVSALDPVGLVRWRRGHGKRCAALRYLGDRVDVNPDWAENIETRVIQEAMRKNQREKAGWEMGC